MRTSRLRSGRFSSGALIAALATQRQPGTIPCKKLKVAHDAFAVPQDGIDARIIGGYMHIVETVRPTELVGLLFVVYVQIPKYVTPSHGSSLQTRVANQIIYQWQIKATLSKIL